LLCWTEYIYVYVYIYIYTYMPFINGDQIVNRCHCILHTVIAHNCVNNDQSLFTAKLREI
jgi:hypothetical protein